MQLLAPVPVQFFEMALMVLKLSQYLKLQSASTHPPLDIAIVARFPTSYCLSPVQTMSTVQISTDMSTNWVWRDVVLD